MTADPTRLDPPIAIEVTVPLFDAAEGAALRHLNRLHGWPTGEAPLETRAAFAHIEATSTLLRGHRVRLLVTHIDAQGRPTFAFEAPLADPVPSAR